MNQWPKIVKFFSCQVWECYWIYFWTNSHKKSHFHDLIFSFDLLLWIFFLSTPQTFSCHHLTASKFFPSQGTDNYIFIQQDNLSTAAPVFKNINCFGANFGWPCALSTVMKWNGDVIPQFILHKYWVTCYFKAGESWSRFMFLYTQNYLKLEWCRLDRPQHSRALHQHAFLGY